MERLFRKLNLTGKFLVPTLAATVMALATGGYFVQKEVKRAAFAQKEMALLALQSEQRHNEATLQAALGTKADVIGQFMAKTAQDLILFYDYVSLNAYQRIAANDPEVSHTAYLKPDGTPFADFAVPKDGREVLEKRYPIEYDGQLLGYVLVAMSTAVAAQSMEESHRRIGQAMTGVKEEAASAAGRVIRTLAASYAFVLALIAVIAFGVFRFSVVRPLREASLLVAEVGQGNLLRRLHTRSGDEIGRLAGSVNEMAEKLTAMVFRINDSAVGLSQASADILGTAVQVDGAAQQQSSQVERTAAGVQRIHAAVEEVSQGVELLAQAAAESTSSALEMAASTEEVAINSARLAESVDAVNSSIIEMTASITQVAENAESLKGASDLTTSSVAQMDAAIRQVEQNAQETARIAEHVCVDATGGEEAVGAAIAGMDRIRDVSKVVSEATQSLSRKAQDIGRILTVIDEVTAQTTLLSLNAAIIAAQAGEHGKGFSVVAQEIKALAERTDHSTREIALAIDGVRGDTDRVVEALARAEKSISEGHQLSVRAGDSLKKIVSRAENAARQVDQIARAVVEQSQGSRVIREAMSQVAALVDQIAKATAEQRKGGELILAASQRMGELTAHVKNSTQEQSRAGKVIARSMEQVHEMVKHFKETCAGQSRESAAISEAIAAIRKSAEGNVDSTRILNDVVSRLTRQNHTLQKEMAAFKVE